MKTILSILNAAKISEKMKTLIVSFFVSSLLVLISTSASSQVLNSTYSVTPPASTRSDPPSVMLSLSRDHQYFFRAYNDYTDLDANILDANGNILDVNADGNPNVETTYKHIFSYFGYFDSSKCYVYDNGADVYNPVSIINTTTVADLTEAQRTALNISLVGNEDVVTSREVCTGNQWHGNFLNWMSMSRMDIVRRIFFGGDRSTDIDGLTILERAYLPSDAHSFAKYYNGRGGASISELTPFAEPANNNDDVDDINEGYTFCNTSYVDDGTDGASASQDVQGPPLIRTVQGNWQLWASNERWQCTWDDEGFGDDGNSNQIGSGIFAENSDPSEAGDNGQEFIARVSVCVDNLIGEEDEFCKTYPNGNVKPIGILQLYGDDGLIDFGLMSGSYERNTEGGVLRKNTGPLTDEVDVANTGSFIFTDTSDSIIKFLSALRPWGYQLSDGDYIGNGDDFDNCTFQLTEIPGQTGAAIDQNTRCNSWGNPISEVFAETIRYMAGLTANPNFAVDDTAFIDQLTTTPWIDPLNEDENLCSDLNTIVINASVSSYDDNNAQLVDVAGGIDGVTIPAAGNITDTMTDIVGANEGINGNNFFVGIGSNDNDEFCTSKRVDALSDAMGLCPEAPSVSGSFSMAGIALYAHNNDIRPDLPGNQTVNTFAISLATNVPVIEIPRTNSNDVLTILPAYRLLQGVDGNDNPAGGGGGALVDFRIVQPHTRIGNTNTFDASYYVNWEDSEQGGDYDQDLWGTISYVLDEDANTLQVTTQVFAESTGGGQLFGFVTNGTSQDGFHAFSGIEGADFTDTTGVPGCNNCRANSENGGGQRGPQSHTFNLQASTAGTLESPLFYAAKYGGFTESLAAGESRTVNDLPDDVDGLEFDTDEDGLPDNFFFVINPFSLFESLEEALQNILAQDAAASSAVANFAGQNGFGNIIIQGIYQESISDVDNEQVTWTGELFSFFIDNFGIFREDSNGNGILDGYNTDIGFEYDSTSDAPLIQRFNVQFDIVDGAEVPRFTVDGELDVVNTGALIEQSELDTLWDAAERLRLIDNTEIINNRVFNAPPLNPQTGNPGVPGSGARYIFTHIDSNLNGDVDDDEQHIFDSQLFTAQGAGPDAVPFLGVVNENQAINIVNFTRGLETSNEDLDPVNFNSALNFRSRTIIQTDQNGNDELQTFRLGDLVNSTPVTVAGPSENYDTLFDDESYEGFSNAYEFRRQVTYVGANDGLLHAFNNGFRDPSVNGTAYVEDPQDPFLNGALVDSISENAIARPLGTEIWAYAPFNLLPHLQFLTLPNYLHNFYIDGSAEAFDVKIFDGDIENCDILNGAPLEDSCRYINGWGTILIVGMRQGGGDFPITDAAGNAVQDVNNNPFITRSSYVILDVTNPELEPKVLAEVNHPDLNFTTSNFDVFYSCDNGANVNVCTDDDDPNNNFDGTWSLVFGSGPNDVRTFESDETAKVFSYNLDGGSEVDVNEVMDTDSGELAVNSFVGGISVRDWDNGDLGFRNDDVAYFGTVQNTDTTDAATGDVTRSDSGAVFRYFPESVTDSPLGTGNRTNLLIDTDRPVFETPITLSRETLTNNVLASWVYIGTGIFLARENADITEMERFIGVIEPIDQDALGDLSAPVTSLVGFNVLREDSDLLTYDSVTFDDLQDVTTVEVLNGGFLNGNIATPVLNSNGDPATTGDLRNDLIVTNPPTALGATTVDTVGELSQHILAATNGWYRDLPSNVAVSPSSRITGAPVPFINALFFTSFTPESQTGIGICDGETGVSQLFVIDQTSGVASTIGSVGVDSATGVINTASDPVSGNISSPLIFSSESLGTNDGVVISQKDNGGLTGQGQAGGRTDINDVEDIRSGWREIN